MRQLASIFVLLTTLVFSTASEASVEAIVISDKAVIWADVQQTAAIGYVAKGKVVTVGEVPRNKNQVVPIVVSGRVAYINLQDISFDLNSNGAPQDDVVYKRFKEIARKKTNQHVAFGVVGFSGTEKKDASAGRNGDSWSFIGGSLRGDAPTPTKRVGVLFIGEYLYAENKPETFRVFELALGLSFRLIEASKFNLKLEVAPLLVPYVQYESDPLFTLNGYGYGILGQVAADIFFNESWGIEGSYGIQTLKLVGIDRPAPFKDFSPLFNGGRWFLGAVHRF